MKRKYNIAESGRARLLIITGALILLTAIASYGDEDNRSGDISVPKGMEIIKEGDVNVLVPKGSRLTIESSFKVKEDSEQYASRKFMDAEERFNRVEKELDSLREEMKSLKEDIDGIKREKIPATPPVSATE